MLITLLFVPVRHRTRKPLAVSKGKQDVVHRGPYRRTHWTRCRRRWKFRVSNLTPVWEGGVSGGERERGMTKGRILARGFQQRRGFVYSSPDKQSYAALSSPLPSLLSSLLSPLSSLSLTLLSCIASSLTNKAMPNTHKKKHFQTNKQKHFAHAGTLALRGSFVLQLTSEFNGNMFKPCAEQIG